MKGKWFQTFDSERRALRQNSYTGISASQRGNDFEAPDLELGYTYFFPSWKFQIASSHKTQNNKTWKANCCVARCRPWYQKIITSVPLRARPLRGATFPKAILIWHSEADRADDSIQKFYGLQSLILMYARGVFVLKTTKTKNPKFTAEFDRGKDLTEDN